ncbi:MAG: hypothetical protein ACKOBN_00730, partial [Flavobacteriales bacterium]
SYPLVHNIVPLVNIKSYVNWEKGNYTRIPGWAKIKRNDVVVFNFPSGDTAILDPRTPSGLMGHDFHGLVNQEALFEFALKNNVSAIWERRDPSAQENKLLEQFIQNHDFWKIRPELVSKTENSQCTWRKANTVKNTVALFIVRLINEKITSSAVWAHLAIS